MINLHLKYLRKIVFSDFRVTVFLILLESVDYLEGLNNRNFVDEAWTVYSVPSPGITLNATVYEDSQPIEQFEITMKEPGMGSSIVRYGPRAVVYFF